MRFHVSFDLTHTHQDNTPCDLNSALLKSLLYDALARHNTYIEGLHISVKREDQDVR